MGPTFDQIVTALKERDATAEDRDWALGYLKQPRPEDNSQGKV